MCDEKEILYSSIVLYVQQLRAKDVLPKAGVRELYLLCKEHFGEKFTIGHNKFCDLLRANHLMLRRRRYRPRTTYSGHGFRRWDDLVNTTPKYTPERPGDLVVADITYIAHKDGFAYLSLLTDAYSRCIVGHCLHPTLEVEGCLVALREAFSFYQKYDIDTTGLLHHSDRGVQYACRQYIDALKAQGCRISMTQTGDPLHNALAERMNNTLKNSWYISDPSQSFEQARQRIAQAVKMYNEARPHQALGGKTPLQIIQPQHKNPLSEIIAETSAISHRFYKLLNSNQRAKFAKCKL